MLVAADSRRATLSGQLIGRGNDRGRVGPPDVPPLLTRQSRQRLLQVGVSGHCTLLITRSGPEPKPRAALACAPALAQAAARSAAACAVRNATPAPRQTGQPASAPRQRKQITGAAEAGGSGSGSSSSTPYAYQQAAQCRQTGSPPSMAASQSQVMTSVL